MIKIAIKKTQNPIILKFEFPDFITQNESFEFKNIDEANEILKNFVADPKPAKSKKS